MCGITGVITFNPGINEDYLNQTNDSLDAISHRGPNQRIIKKINEYNSIGFVRLSIIDLSENSNQPFHSSQNEITIIFNGEIYNYKELKEKYFLSEKFKSQGDGEILLRMYQKFGENFIDKIKGMFSIVVIDNIKKTTFLYRDRFGIKPLYFFRAKEAIYYCSEIKGLMATGKIKKALNYKEAQIYLLHGLINSNHRTWFDGIYQVKPGYYLKIHRSEINEIKYYDLKKNINETYHDEENITFKKYSNIIKDRFDKSLKQHVNLSDVPVGLHLSGGIDSTVLASGLVRNNINIDSYTFGFDDKQYSEEKDAKKIADIIGISNSLAVLKDSELIGNLEKTLEAEYEPFSSIRVVANHYLYKEYKNSKVILDGAGGDEIGSGYSYHLIPWYLDIIKKHSSKKLIKRIKELIKHINVNKNLDDNDFILGSIAQYFVPGSSTIDGSNYSNKSLFNFKDTYLIESIIYDNTKLNSHLRNAQYNDLMHFKLPRSLRYVDRASMINSTETRVPFLDHELVEICISMPSKFKYLKNNQRYVFKYLSRDTGLEKFLMRNKRTIADPQTTWLKTILKDLVADTLLSDSFLSKDLINHKQLKIYLEEFLKKDTIKNSYLVFQIFIMEMWRRNILDG